MNTHNLVTLQKRYHVSLQSMRLEGLPSNQCTDAELASRQKSTLYTHFSLIKQPVTCSQVNPLYLTENVPHFHKRGFFLRQVLLHTLTQKFCKCKCSVLPGKKNW